MERPLTDWERRLVERPASAPGQEASVVRESLPHLVVTGGCGCGCPSFNVRDIRFPEQPHHLGHYANGWTADSSFGFMLWTGPDGRPISVDVETPPEWSDGDALPDSSSVLVDSPHRG